MDTNFDELKIQAERLKWVYATFKEMDKKILGSDLIG